MVALSQDDGFQKETELLFGGEGYSCSGMILGVEVGNDSLVRSPRPVAVTDQRLDKLAAARVDFQARGMLDRRFGPPPTRPTSQ